MILVTTDGSRRSLRVLPHAARLAAVTGTTLLLTRVLDPLTDCGDEYAGSLAEAAERVAARWQRQLEAQVAGAGVSGAASVVVKERQETPAHAIMRHAQERRARLIAMATHGGGLLRRVAIGSVAVGVLSETTLPVLMAGPRARAPYEGLPYRVLVTTDGSAAASLALPTLQRVFERASNEDVEIALLRVHEAGLDERPSAVALADSERELATFRRRAPRRFPIDTEVREASRHGRVPQEILASAASRESDAIWMSTHGASFSRQVLLGSTALSILGRAPVPVILTRALD